MTPVPVTIITGLIYLAAAYLLGSLPFSLWIGRAFFATDVREHGSGNAGATNTWRVLGWKAGLPVLVLDTAKGFGATFLPYIYPISDPDLMLWARVICGTAAALGHIYPVLAGFRGGKAVATLLGVLLGLMPVPAATGLGIFVVVFLISRIVSLGSVIAGLSLPVLVWFMTEHPPQFFLFSLLISVLILLTHRRNIERLLKGEEARLDLRTRRE